MAAFLRRHRDARDPPSAVVVILPDGSLRLYDEPRLTVAHVLRDYPGHDLGCLAESQRAKLPIDRDLKPGATYYLSERLFFSATFSSSGLRTAAPSASAKGFHEPSSRTSGPRERPHIVRPATPPRGGLPPRRPTALEPLIPPPSPTYGCDSSAVPSSSCTSPSFTFTPHTPQSEGWSPHSPTSCCITPSSSSSSSSSAAPLLSAFSHFPCSLSCLSPSAPPCPQLEAEEGGFSFATADAVSNTEMYDASCMAARAGISNGISSGIRSDNGMSNDCACRMGVCGTAQLALGAACTDGQAVALDGSFHGSPFLEADVSTEHDGCGVVESTWQGATVSKANAILHELWQIEADTGVQKNSMATFVGPPPVPRCRSWRGNKPVALDSCLPLMGVGSATAMDSPTALGVGGSSNKAAAPTAGPASGKVKGRRRLLCLHGRTTSLPEMTPLVQDLLTVGTSCHGAAGWSSWDRQRDQPMVASHWRLSNSKQGRVAQAMPTLHGMDTLGAAYRGSTSSREMEYCGRTRGHAAAWDRVHKWSSQGLSAQADGGARHAPGSEAPRWWSRLLSQ